MHLPGTTAPLHRTPNTPHKHPPRTLLCRLFNVCHGDVALQLQTGKAYLHGCLDLAGRPTVVIRARKHISGEDVRPSFLTAAAA